MLTQTQIEKIKEAYIESISCGDERLFDLLNSNSDLFWGCTNDCNVNLSLLNFQLSLVELAQGFVRNKVDTSNSRSTSSAASLGSSSNFRDTIHQNTSQGTKCNWAKSSGFQDFRRDSAAHAKSQSDSTSDTTGSASSSMSDRSKTVNGGWSTSYVNDRVSASTKTNTEDATCTTTDSSSSEGTPHGITAYTVSPSQSSVTFDKVAGPYSYTFFPETLIEWTFELTFPYMPQVSGGPSTSWFNPGSFPVSCGDKDTPCAPAPSMGRGFNSHYNFSVTLPGLGSIQLAFTKGGNWRQSFTCASGSSSAVSNGSGQSNGQSTTFSFSNSEAKSHSEGERVNDRHRSAASKRDSAADTTATSSDTMRADSETHNGSDSSSHSESQSTNQGSGFGTNHSESIHSSSSVANSFSESIYWSQIFKALSDMWKKIWSEINETHALSFSSVSVAGTMKDRNKCSVKCLPPSKTFFPSGSGLVPFSRH